MRNPLTGLLRKKSRRSTTRKRRSTFASTPNERVGSKLILENILLFTNISVLFAALAHRAALLSNFQTARNFIQRSQISLNVTEHLINIELSLSDVRVDNNEYNIFSAPFINLRIDDFVNDNQAET